MVRVIGTVAAVCYIGCGAGAADPQRHEYESRHMGTTFRVVLYAADKTAADAAAKAAFARVADLDKAMTDYDAKSELMRLCATNDAAPGKPVAVSADLFDVLAKAQAVSEASGGAFDVTVGPLVKLWRNARRTQQLPDAKELADAKAVVGYDKVTLDAAARTVTLKVPGMRLDLGGIGKGYAADAALALLKEKHNVTSALVAAYGDIACSDAPPGKDGWVVDIAGISKSEKRRTLKLANAAVSTSGDLEQFVEIGGVRYSHVLDARTGLGLTGRRSATVVAKAGWQADALTKAASVLPPDKALALIEATDGAATTIVVKETDDAPVRMTTSRRFAGFLASDR